MTENTKSKDLNISSHENSSTSKDSLSQSTPEELSEATPKTKNRNTKTVECIRELKNLGVNVKPMTKLQKQLQINMKGYESANHAKVELNDLLSMSGISGILLTSNDEYIEPLEIEELALYSAVESGYKEPKSYKEMMKREKEEREQ